MAKNCILAAEPGFNEIYTVTVDARVEAGAPGYVKLYRNEQSVELPLQDGLGVAELKVEQKPIVNDPNTPNANANANLGANSTNSATSTNNTSAQTP